MPRQRLHNLFAVEELEPKVMLSADLTAGALGAALSQPHHPAVHEATSALPSHSSGAVSQMFAGIQPGATGVTDAGSSSNSAGSGAAETSGARHEETAQAQAPAVPANTAGATNNSAAVAQFVAANSNANSSKVSELIQTLKGPNGPPLSPQEDFQDIQSTVVSLIGTLTSGSPRAQQTLTNASFANGLLDMTNVTLAATATFDGSGNLTGGSVTITVASATLLPNNGFFTASLTPGQAQYALSGSYSFTGGDATKGTYSLTAGSLSLNMGEVLTLTASGIQISYDPNGASTQTVATINNATLSSPKFTDLGTLNLSGVTVTADGFSIPNLTWTSTGSVSLGPSNEPVLTASPTTSGSTTTPAVTFSIQGFSYQDDGTDGLQLGGSITATVNDAVLFPNVPLLDVQLGTVSGSYNFGSNVENIGQNGANDPVTVNPATPYLQLSIPNLNLSFGDAFTLNVGTITISPSQPDILSVQNVAVNANLFSGVPVGASLSQFTLTQTGFSIASLEISTTAPVTVGSFLSVVSPGGTTPSIAIAVSNFTVNTANAGTSNPVVSGTITASLGTVTLFPGSSLITSSFTGVQASYALASSTNPGQLSFSATGFTLSIGNLLTVTATGTTQDPALTLTPGDSPLMTIASATLVFPAFSSLQVSVTDLTVSTTGFSLSASIDLTSNFTVGSIFTLDGSQTNPIAVTLTNLDYTLGGSLSGTIGFSTPGVSLNLGGAITASTGQLTGTYNLGTGQFSANLDNFSLTLANFASVTAGDISVTYTPANDGSATFLVGATGVNVFVGVGSGSSEVGVQISNANLALAVFRASTANGNGITYAFDASGAAALVGLPANTLSVSAGNLDVRVNTAGAISTSVNVNGVAIPLVFAGNQQSASATGLSISIGSYVSITGDFAFAQFTSGSQTYVEIGAENLNATLAVGGVSVTVTGASLGLLIQPGAGSSPTTYALTANGGTDSLNGIPSLTLTASGLSVLVRNGLDPSTITAPQIVTPDGALTPNFSALGSGTSALTELQGTITLGIANFVSIQGSFGFEETSGTGSFSNTTFLTVGATGLTITLGTATTNVSVTGANLALVIEPGSGGSAATYALEATATSASLNGVPLLTLSATSITVLVRNGLDVTASGVPNSVATPGGTATLQDMPSGTSSLAVVEGNLTLSVTGFGSLQGSFGFESFSDGQSGESEIAVGATDTTVTLGSQSTNLTVSGASFALLIRPGANGSATTYALEATATSASLNGIPDLQVSATNIEVLIRDGLDLSTSSGFPTSIPTPNGSVTPDFSNLPAGAGNALEVQASLALTISEGGATFVSLSGNFVFQDDTIGTSTYLLIGGTDISVTLSTGQATNAVSLTLANATLGVVVDEGTTTGYALEIIGDSVPTDTALNGIPGLTLNATNLYVLARNGLDASTLPSGLPTSLQTSDGSVSLAFAALGSGSGSLYEVSGDLTLDIAGFVSIQGDFGIEKFTDGNNNSDLAIAASGISAVLGTNQLNLTVSGASLALLVVPGSGYALDASGGNDSLNGIPELSLSSSGLTVLVEQGVNPANVKNLPTSIGLSGSSSAVPLSFADLAANNITSNTTEVYGTITIAVADFVSLSGNFSFTETTSGTVTTILVAGSNVSAFVGDSAGGFGVQISGASFALAIFRDSTTAASTYALQASAPSITLQGLPSDISLSGSATVSINTTGGAVNQSIPGGQSLIFSAGQGNIESFGGSLSLAVGPAGSPVFTLTGSFSVTTSGTGSAAEILVGASNVSTAVGTSVAANGGASFSLSNGTLGLVIFESGSATPGYALVASATAAAAAGGVSAGGTLTIRRNTTTSAQNVDITVGPSVIPVVFAANEVATGTPPNLTAFQQILVGNASLSIDNFIQIKASQGSSTPVEVGGSQVASTLALNSVTILLTDGAANPGPTDTLVTISATSASFTTFSGAVTSSQATTANLDAPVNPSGSWKAGDEDLVLTNVTFSIGGVVTFTANQIDLQHYGTTGTNYVDNFAFTGALITISAGSQQLLTLGGNPTFQYSSTSGFSLVSFSNPTFGILGQTIASVAGGDSSNSARADISAPGSDPSRADVSFGPINLNSPSISVGGFSFSFNGGSPTLTATVTITAASASISTSAVSTTITNLTANLNISVGINLSNPAASTISAGDFTASASSATISLGSFLTLTASPVGTTPGVTINPSAGPNQDMLAFGSLSATINAGPLSLTGTASGFAIEGNGSVVTKPGFSVSVAFGANPDGSVNTSGSGLPSWLPIQSASVSVKWPDFADDPGHFTLIISISVSTTSIEGLPLNISGSVTNLVIDPSQAFPLVSIGSGTLTVSGNLYGGSVSGTLVIGTVSFDSQNNIVDALTGKIETINPNTGVATDTANPAVGAITTVVYGGMSLSFSIGGFSGFSLMLALSDLGPLDIYINVGIPIPIGDTGLFISNLNAGIAFDATFPTLTVTNPPQASQALQLNEPAFNSPANLTAAQWQAQLTTQVVNQYVQSGGQSDWANFFNGPMIIEAGATIYAGSADAFAITGNLMFSTQGQFLVTGTVTLGGTVNLGVKVYADLSQVVAGDANPTVDVLFLIQVPAPSQGSSLPPLVDIYGVVTFNYNTTTDTLTIDMAGEADYNILNGLQAQLVAQGIQIVISPTEFMLTVASATFTVPQVQSTPLGTASGSVTIENNNGTIDIWGGFLLTADLTGLAKEGITITGQVFVKLNTSDTPQSVQVQTGGTAQNPTYTDLTLNPESFELFITGTADFSIGGATAFEISGTLDLAIANGSLTLFVDATLLLGSDPSNPILTFNASGVVFIQMVASSSIPAGFAAKLELSLATGSSAPAGVEFGLNFLLVMNTTGVDITYIIPSPVGSASASNPSLAVPTIMGPNYSQPYNPNNPSADLVSYEITVNGQRAIDIPAGPPSTGQTNYATWSPTSIGPYVIVLGRGSITVDNAFTLEGNINILASVSGSSFVFSLDLNVELLLQANGSTVFTFDAVGGILIEASASGGFGIAAALDVTLSGGVPSGLGFTFNNVSFLLELNTTGADQLINGITVPGGGGFFAEVAATGDLVMLGGVLDFNGSFTFTVSSTSLDISFNTTVTILGVSFIAKGSAGIYYDNSPGIAIYLELALPNGESGIEPVPELGNNFVVSGTFILQLNTTGKTRTDGNGNSIAPGFDLSIQDLGVYLYGFDVNGSLDFSISSAGISIEFNLSLNFFDIVTITITGFLHPNGDFYLYGSASMNLFFGDSSLGVGVSGSIFFSVYNLPDGGTLNGVQLPTGVGFSAGASGELYLEVAGSQYNIVSVAVSIALNIGNPSYFSLSLSASIFPEPFTIGFSHTFTWDFQNSPPSNVAPSIPPPPPPPAVAGVNNGVLTLFLGQDVGDRVNSDGTETDPVANENYALTLVSNDGGSETIQVVALGQTQQFSGVTSIVVPDTTNPTSSTTNPNGVVSTDTITIDNAIDVPVTATLGPSNNTLTTGSGNANLTINGAGNNSVTMGSGGTVAINGGGANQITAPGSTSVSIVGGGANSIAVGGGSSVTISGSGGNAVSLAGSGGDTVTVSGNGSNTVTTTGANSETVSISGTGGNTIAITGGSPTVTVSSSASGADHISTDSGSASSVSVSGSGADGVTLSGTGGGNVGIGGNGNDTVITAGYGDITITGSGNDQIITGSGGGSVFLEGGGNDTVTTGSGYTGVYDEGSGGTTVDGGSGGGLYSGGTNVSGNAFTSKATSSVTGSNDNFVVDLDGYSSYTVTASSITYGSFVLDISGVSGITLTAGSSSSTNTFDLNGWTGSTTLNGAGGNNLLEESPPSGRSNLNFVLTNSSLQITGSLNQTIELSDIQTADLTGGSVGSNNFTISGWSGGGTLTGPPGTSNTVTADDDVALFDLTNSSLTRTGDGSFSLSNIQTADLTGGPGTTFDVGYNAAYSPAGSSSASWTGSATLNGQGGSDIDNITLTGTNAGIITIADSGTAVGDVANIYTPANTIVTSNDVSAGSQQVLYSGLATLNIDGTQAGLDYYVQRTTPSTTINTDGGSSLVDVGSTAAPGNVAPGVLTGIQGLLSISGGGSLLVDDSGASSNYSGTLTSSSLTGLGLGLPGIQFSGLSAFTLKLGSGANSLSITGMPAPTATISAVSSDNTVNLSISGDFNGTLNLTGFNQGSVAITGNFNGTLNDSSPGLLNSVSIGSLSAGTGNLSLGASLTAGGIGSLTIGGTLAGTVSVSGTLGSLTVKGAVSGTVSETGLMSVLSIGSLSLGGSISATNPSDPPTYSSGSLGDIGSATVNGNLAGTLSVSGNVGSLAIAGNLSGTVAVQGALSSVTVGQELSGSLSESGAVTLLSIGLDLAATGTITLVNSVAPTIAGVTTFNIGTNLAGIVTVSGGVGRVSIGGSLSNFQSGSLTARSIGTLTLDGDLTATGTITTTNGGLTTATIDGNLFGKVSVNGSVQSLTVGTAGQSDQLGGPVTVTGTLTNLVVNGTLSGTVSETGTIASATITGNLSGSVSASNGNDSPAWTGGTSFANITLLTVDGNLSGTVTVTGNAGTINVGTAGQNDSLSGSVTVNGSLTTLDVTGNVSGQVSETGPVASITITGSLAPVSGSAASITAANPADKAQWSASQTYLAGITNLTVGQNLAGTVTVSGDLGTLTVGTVASSPANALSGTVNVGGALTTLNVNGNVSGLVTETGPISSITITGSLAPVTNGSVTSPATIDALNASDHTQLPPFPPATTPQLPVQTSTSANITLVQIDGNLGGTLNVSGSVATLNVGSGTLGTTPGTLGTITTPGILGGTVTVQGTITTLLVTSNLSGTVSESGTIATLTIDGSLTASGYVRADNSNDPYYVKGSANHYGAINYLTIGQNFAGTVFVSSNINAITIVNGQMASTAQLTIGGNLPSFVIGPNQLSVGQNMAGTITVGGNLDFLRVAGGTPGVIVAGHIGAIEVYGGFEIEGSAEIVLNVTENGVQRLIDATPLSNEYPAPYAASADPYPVATPGTPYINIQFIYEDGTPTAPGSLSNPQVTLRITNNVSTAAAQFDLSLITYNDTAKFNLARLDSAPGLNNSNGVSGIGNVVVEGDLLTAVTAQALGFFSPQTLPQPSLSHLPPGTIYPLVAGIILPNDNLIGVSIRDHAPNGEIEANSIQGVGFGSYSFNGTIFTGFQSNALIAQALLSPGTYIVQAAGTFRVAFADLPTQQEAFYFDSQPNGSNWPNPPFPPAPGGQFNINPILFAVESQVTANAGGTANIVTPSNVARGAVTALINILPTYTPNNGQLLSSVVQTVAFNGDGAAIATNQWISQSITSTGPLGDLYLGAPEGITNVTAPSIFGSIASNGPITGTIQTTGIRVDPITGAVSNVSANIGNLFVVTQPNPPNPPWPFWPFGPGPGPGFPAFPGWSGFPGYPGYPYPPGPPPVKPYVVSTVIYGNGGPDGGIAGRIIDRGNMYSEIGANGGMTGLIAIQGNLGVSQASNYGTLRFGGLDINGQLNGTVVILGQQVGDVTINGGLKDGAEYAVAGAVVGNLTVNGGLDSTSSMVFGSQVGSSPLGTNFTENGANQGIIAAVGTILFAPHSPPPAPHGYVFNDVGANTSSVNFATLQSIFAHTSLDQGAQNLQGLQAILLGLDNLKVNSAGNLTTSQASTAPATAVTGNFNSASIKAGNTLWFNSSVQVNNFDNAPGVQLYFSASTITFTVGTTNYSIAVPAAEIIFSPNTTAAVSTTFSNGIWVTTVPENYNGQIFLTGAAWQVPVALPGNIRNVTWTGTFTSNTVGLQTQWQWGAAVYSSFIDNSANYNQLGVEPVQTNPPLGPYTAGTPFDYIKYVVSGAGGNGQNNYTGQEGGNANIVPPDDLIDP